MADEPPKHKPSEPHTLDEVLKSLQDLIRNDLLEEEKPPPPPKPPLDPSVPRKRGRPRKETIAPEASDPQPESTEDLDAVLDSLTELVDRELRFDDVSAADLADTVPASEPPRHPLALDDMENQEQPDAPENESAAQAAEDLNPPEENQQEFALDLPFAPESESETVELPESEPAAPQEALPFEPVGEAPTPAPADIPVEALPADTATQDDIPVLDDVVAHPQPEGAAPDESSDPRALAIRAVARLNIERRSRGEPPLEAATIDRLEQILREELERRTQNSDNTAS
jgi:hypothetical protein